MSAFAVSALAVAARRANAVGAVRLVCEEDALAIELVRAGAYAIGFVPGAVVEARAFRVPYTAVRGLVRRGPVLWLALDPRVATPYSRFALARFGDAPPEALLGAHRARTRARLATFVAPVPLGALAAALAPRGLVAGPLGLASVAVLGALVAFAALRALTAALTWGGPSSDRRADALEAELTSRLGLAPAVARAGGPLEEPLRAPAAEGSSIGWRVPALVAAASSVIVLAMAFLARTLGEVKAPPRATPLATGVAAAVRVPAATAIPTPATSLQRCVCTRADSPLWKDPLPSLAVLLSPRHGESEVKPGPHGYDFDVVAVNAGAKPLRDVRIVVTFARRTRKGRRVGATDRGLFRAELAPGHAVKWHVKGPGTEMRIDVSPAPLLATGRDDDPKDAVAAADPAAFRALLSANHDTARMHAAMMLAWLRDPSAHDAALSVPASSEADERLRAAILRATAPVFACDVSARGGTLEACVMNTTEKPATSVVLREVGEHPRTWPIAAAIPIHDGVRIATPLGSGDPPSEVEVTPASP